MQDVKLLLDTGASCCLVSATLCRELGLRVQEGDVPDYVTLPDGRSTRIQGLARVTMHCQGIVFNVMCWAVDMVGFDVVLGEDWLKRKQAVLCYRTYTVSLPFPAGRCTYVCMAL